MIKLFECDFYLRCVWGKLYKKMCIWMVIVVGLNEDNGIELSVFLRVIFIVCDFIVR